MQIHRLCRSLPRRVLLRDGYPGGDSSRRLHRLYGMRGGLPCARHLRRCGRACGIHERYRVQRRRGSEDQGLRRACNQSEKGCSAHYERPEKGARVLINQEPTNPEAERYEMDDPVATVENTVRKNCDSIEENRLRTYERRRRDLS